MAYVTKREIKQLSSPACSPQYTVTIPAGTECELVARQPRRSDYAVKNLAKVTGGSWFDRTHYYIWIDANEITEIL